MSQYRPCIPDKCNASEARLWKCSPATINRPYFPFFSKLTQRWCNILIPMSKRRCEYKVVVTTLYLRCHCNIHDLLWGEFFIQSWGNIGTTLWFDVVASTLWRRCEFDATISTLQQLWQYSNCSTPWVKLIIQRWCYVEVTL